MVVTLCGFNIKTYSTDINNEIEYAENLSQSNKITNINIINKENNDTYKNKSVSIEIANILGYNIDEQSVYSLIFGEELINQGVEIYKTETEKEFQNKRSVNTKNNNSIILKIENKVDQSSALLKIEEPDDNYNGAIVQLTEEDRNLLERLVTGEAGGEGKEGAALVAQAIRDTMVYKGYNSIEDIRQKLKYSGSINKEPNQDVKDAVAFIFDEGGMAVKHKIFYFYAPKLVESEFHEQQKFIIEHGGHRFFSEW